MVSRTEPIFFDKYDTNDNEGTNVNDDTSLMMMMTIMVTMMMTPQLTRPVPVPRPSCPRGRG